MKYTFKSNLSFGPHIEYIPTIDELSNETMLFSAGWDFARKNGGPITQRVLDIFEKENIPQECPLNRHIVIDTRVHMLMKGFYPAIPGYHGDGFPRQTKYDQPDLKQYFPDVKHWTCVLSSNKHGCSHTHFVLTPIELEVDEENVWKSVSTQVQEKVNMLELTTERQRDGQIIRFDQQSLHCASPAHTPGWRFFFRLSYYHRPPNNKIRKQVQVYTTTDGGW